MFEKFNEIRKTSAAYYANQDDGVVRTMTDLLDEMKDRFDDEDFLNGKTRVLIEALPKSDLIELTGIIYYGRDAVVESQTRQTLLDAYIKDLAYLSNDEGHAGHLSGKPIHLYLARAERKLNGELDEPKPRDEDDYTEDHDEDYVEE
jgi:hypothetical protein